MDDPAILSSLGKACDGGRKRDPLAEAGTSVGESVFGRKRRLWVDHAPRGKCRHLPLAGRADHCAPTQPKSDGNVSQWDENPTS